MNALTRRLLDSPPPAGASLLNAEGKLMTIDYKNVYRDIAPKEVIIAQAVAAAKVMAGGTLPNLEQVKTGAVNYVCSLAIDKLKGPTRYLLENAVAEFQMIEGERPALPEGLPDNEEARAWRDKFDEFLIAKFDKDLQRAVGPSALGEHFTDSDVDDAEVMNVVVNEISERLAEAGRPMDNANTSEAKPSVNKTLSAAGVVEADLIPYASGVPGAKAAAEDRVIDLVEARGKVELIVGTYALRQGDNFGPFALDELLVSAFDDDNFIAGGAIERMGGTFADQPFFLAYRASPTHKEDTMSAAVAALASGSVIEPPKGAKAKKIKITKPNEAAAAPSLPAAAPPLPGAAAAPPLPPMTSATVAPGVSIDWSSIVNVWTANAQDKDEQIADALGISRGTVGNLRAGKPTRGVKANPAEVRKILLQKVALLQSAADMLA